MQTKIRILGFLVILLQGFLFENVSYEGHLLVRITPQIEEHLKFLRELENNPDFDVWNGIKQAHDHVDVRLSPKSFKLYSKLFKIKDIPFSILNSNVQEILEEQQKSMKRDLDRNVNLLKPKIVGKYARYNEIISYIASIADENPDIASYYTAGRTYQNRELRVLVLKTRTSQRVVWIDGGIHAREWISPSTNIWIIDKLVNGYRNKDPVVVDLLNYYEFHILPIVNPDGYEYTHTTTRLWRKNRAPNTGSSCVGTDLNRNFGYQWGVAGSSTDPCSDIFAGSKASSELETQALQEAISKLSGKLDVYFNLHTYGNMWMPIWSYTTQLPTDYDELLRVSQIGVDAIKAVYGISFRIGSPANIFSPTGGGTIDWVRQFAGVKYPFGLELRPGQTGQDSIYGFALPEDRVPLAGEETYQGIMAVIKDVKSRNY